MGSRERTRSGQVQSDTERLKNKLYIGTTDNEPVYAESDHLMVSH